MNKHLSRSALGFGLAAALTACGGAPGGDGNFPRGGDAPDLAMIKQGTPDLAMAAQPMPDLAMPAQAGYPPGPYGNAVGDTVENLKFQGYFAATATTGLASDAPNKFGDVSLDMLRQVKGGKYLMLFMGGFT
ncbi:MAG: hypothetical protein EXR72_06900 [Myxococcales bacterium]|nr:hypothetical protein [Myxococcales bacterium]